MTHKVLFLLRVDLFIEVLSCSMIPSLPFNFITPVFSPHTVLCYVGSLRARLEELRMFLENETWELCPVKSNFNIAQLHVSQHHKTEGKRG